jgi:hypothetical protein
MKPLKEIGRSLWTAGLPYVIQPRRLVLWSSHPKRDDAIVAHVYTDEERRELAKALFQKAYQLGYDDGGGDYHGIDRQEEFLKSEGL